MFDRFIDDRDKTNLTRPGIGTIANLVIKMNIRGVEKFEFSFHGSRLTDTPIKRESEITW